MSTTSVSLLRRLQGSADDSAWDRFVDIYAPLIYRWGRNRGLSAADADDLLQDVLRVLLAELPTFEYDYRGRFRSWLRTITVNKAADLRRRNQVRRTQSLDAASEVFESSNVDEFEETAYRDYLIRRVRDLVEVEFEPITWKACWLQITEGLPAQQIGEQLGISANAVRVAKCRVLRRLRQELSGLIDE